MPPELREPVRSGGIVPTWVLTSKELDRLPEAVRRRWTWETLVCADGEARAFGRGWDVEYV